LPGQDQVKAALHRSPPHPGDEHKERNKEGSHTKAAVKAGFSCVWMTIWPRSYMAASAPAFLGCGVSFRPRRGNSLLALGRVLCWWFGPGRRVVIGLTITPSTCGRLGCRACPVRPSSPAAVAGRAAATENHSRGPGGPALLRILPVNAAEKQWPFFHAC